MKRVFVVEKEKISELKELKKITRKLSSLSSNIVVFGLPGSGKSTLIKEVCRNSKRFSTLEEEEILNHKDLSKVKKKIKGKHWIVGHQFPNLSEKTSNQELAEFCAKKLELNKRWAILRIKTP